MVVCPNCGAHLVEGSAFCSRCGTRLAPPRPVDTTPILKADTNRYARIAKSQWENMENREIAVDELKRLGARKELMEIARSMWISEQIKKRARDALRSMH